MQSNLNFKILLPFLILWTLAAQLPAQVIERVSLDEQGGEIPSSSTGGLMDLRGEWLVFGTAEGLVPGDASGAREIYLKNLRTGVIERITSPTNGGEPDEDSSLGLISANAEVVLFRSTAGNLVSPPPSNGKGLYRTYAFDRTTGELELVSYQENGDDITDHMFGRGLSYRGRFVLMSGTASMLAQDTDTETDLYVRDRKTGLLELIDLGNSASTCGFITGNGRLVAFETRVSLTAGDTNGRADTYVLDRETDRIQLASCDMNGSPSSSTDVSWGDSSVSEDGRFVVFTSSASDLIPGWNNGGRSQIYRKDLLTGELVGISENPNGTGGTTSSFGPRISACGDVVVFASTSSDLDPRDFDSEQDIYAWSSYNPFPRLLSVSPQTDRDGNGPSYLPWSGGRTAFSGEQIAFTSSATDLLLTPDTNGAQDVFIVSGVEADQDHDLMLDAAESIYGTSSTDQDSDDDGLSDGEEFLIYLDDPTWRIGPTGSSYRIRQAQSWNDASLDARVSGYELVSISSQQENDWLLDEFGELASASGMGLWLGLNNFGGTLNWSSGEVVTYLNWAPGEPSANVYAAFMGGPNSANPGAWYSDFAGIGSANPIWERPSDFPSLSRMNPLLTDSDSDGLQDGTEFGVSSIVWDGDIDFDGIPDFLGTDPNVFQPDLDPLRMTNPLDADSDDDGLSDGDEDTSLDGVLDALETDPFKWDTDKDTISDGVERGVVTGLADTSGLIFVPDSDPLTTTSPIAVDTDNGGVDDGIEDQNQNGAIDSWETDPNDPNDEVLAFYVSNLIPDERVHFEVHNAAPLQGLFPGYSTRGPGPTALGIGVSVELSVPIKTLAPVLSDRNGRASWDGPRVPASLGLGIPIWLQLVEVSLNGSPPRISNPILLPVGAN